MSSPDTAPDLAAEHDALEVRVVDGESEAGITADGGLVTGWHTAGVDVLLPSRLIPRQDQPPKQRGGSPILFPNPGPLSSETYPDLPQHGIARTAQWRRSMEQSLAPNIARLELRSTTATAEQYPHQFMLSRMVALSDRGHSLSESVMIRNMGPDTMPLCFGLHPYFAVPLDRKPEITTNIPGFKPADDISDAQECPYQRDVELAIPGVGTVRMTTSGPFDRLVVWSEPGEPFVCIEPWAGGVGSLVVPEERINLGSEAETHFVSRISFAPATG